MVEALTLAALAAAGVTSLFMAWAIGAGSSGSTPFAPAVGAGAISVMRAGFLVGILGFAGAVVQGENVSQTVGHGLVEGTAPTALAATVALVIAAALVALGVFRGYPIATAFTVTGAVIGSGLALGGDPAWDLYRRIALFWLLTPLVGGSIAYVTARLLRAKGVRERVMVPVLAALAGAAVANMEFAILGGTGDGASVAGVLADRAAVSVALARVGAGLGLGVVALGVVSAWMRRDADQGQRAFLISMGSLVAFSAGGSQVGLAVGPLLPLLAPYEVGLTPVLVLGGLGLLAGSWTVATRMIKSLARDYSSLGPRRSIAALVPSFLIAQAAVLFGLPISFNEIIVSAIVGSGLAAGRGGISRRKGAYTVLAWVGSLVVAVVASYLVVLGLGAVV